MCGLCIGGVHIGSGLGCVYASGSVRVVIREL
jgi:hypothetical protein